MILAGHHRNPFLHFYAMFIRQIIRTGIHHFLRSGALMDCVDSRNPRILLAEDNPINQRIAERMLKHLVYPVDVVANGLEALKALEHQHYDVVLMDIQMPEMDGLEAARAIRNRLSANEQPRIIAVTAFALDYSREMCIEAGMDDYIAKPVKKGDLAEILKRHRP